MFSLFFVSCENMRNSENIGHIVLETMRQLMVSFPFEASMEYGTYGKALTFVSRFSNC